MHALLVFFCGTVGACFIASALIVTALFAFTGHAPDLARAAFTLAVWAAGFGLAFLVVSLVGVTAGVLEPINPPAKEGSHADQ